MSIFKHHSHADSHGQLVTDGKPLAAPEIHADGAVSALTVLAMLLAIICGRRNQSAKAGVKND